MKVEPLSVDFEMHLDKKNCKLLKKMVNHAKNSEHQRYIDEFVNFILLTYMRDLYHESIPEIVGAKDDEDQ